MLVQIAIKRNNSYILCFFFQILFEFQRKAVTLHANRKSKSTNNNNNLKT